MAAPATLEELLDFLPLFPDDDEAAILDRMRAWANEGLDPDEDTDLWVDTREGSHWWIGVMPSVRELARLYDLAGTEVPASGMVVWAWADYLDDHAEVQDIVRLPATFAVGEATFTGPEDTAIPIGTTVGVEPVSEDAPAPEYEVTEEGVIDGTGSVTLPVRAVEAGVAGNVAAGALSPEPVTPLLDVTVTNDEPMRDGSEAESDENLRERVIFSYQGQGAGNRRDYQRWARAWAGVGHVTVIPLWNGAGTVKVIVTGMNGEPLSSDIVDALQADLDPTVGRGDGTAPVGAQVTVETAVARMIEVEATVECEDGYSLDGFGGTVAIRADIEEALRDYIERVLSDDEVVFRRVEAAIVTVEGVHDVADVTVEGGTANVPITADPAQVAQLTMPPTLTEGDV